MTFYQELQLDQKGSKDYVAGFKNPKEKFKHIAIYLFKIVLILSFSTLFISAFSLVFGKENSIAGLVAFLCIMTFRFTDFGIRASHSIANVVIIYSVFAIGPKLSNLVSVGWAFWINVICIFILVIFGCHNVKMFNHSIIVLSYLFLQYYDVSGDAFKMRLIALSVGAVMTVAVSYFKHRKTIYNCSFKDIFLEFNLSSERTKWQFRFTFGVSSAILIAAILGFSKPIWAGIAAMSVLMPIKTNLVDRAKERINGNIYGSFIFFAIYLIIPQEFRMYIGIIGGFCQALSGSYLWQTAFNSVSALSVSATVLGFSSAIIFRIINNIFGSLYALLFDKAFEWGIRLVKNAVSKISNVIFN